MKLTLQVDGALHPVTLTEEGVTIGRGDQATIRIQANAVSRVHARIFLKDGRPHVMDMKSLNGTSLNGVTLAEPAPLHPGDTVLLGEAVVKWVPDGGPAAVPGSTFTVAPRSGTSRISLEDRAFDASGSILVPHASLEAMLAQARAKVEKHGLADRAHFRTGNARELPYPDESFDVLYNGYMFDLIPLDGFAPILKEMARVLKPGGSLVLINMSKLDERKTLFERIYERGWAVIDALG